MIVIYASTTLFRNKRFALNKMFQQNSSKFAILYLQKFMLIYSFFISYNFTFSFMNPRSILTQTRVIMKEKLKFYQMKNEWNYMGFLKLHRINVSLENLLSANLFFWRVTTYHKRNFSTTNGVARTWNIDNLLAIFVP